MDDQEFLHKLSVETNVNIEFLKDLPTNEKFWTLIKTQKVMDAIKLLRDLHPMVGLWEAKKVVEAFVRQYAEGRQGMKSGE